MDAYTRATHKWAAEQVGISPERVIRVAFDTENGVEGCPTCGPDPASFIVRVWYTGGQDGLFKSWPADPLEVVRGCLAALD